MKVLVACEFSGTVRDAFAELGHDAWSCDILDCESGGKHIKKDIREVISWGWEWDLMISHPPCTYLTNAAEWLYKDDPGKNLNDGTLFGEKRRVARKDAIEFVKLLYNAPIKKVAVENPVGVLSSAWMKPSQYIQPYEYGEDASKKTCLWLKNLPHLKPTGLFPPRLAKTKNGMSYTFRWGNQTDGGWNRLAPSEDRWKARSKTYQGWANAMASQWGQRSG